MYTCMLYSRNNINLFLSLISNVFTCVDLIQSAWTQNNQTGQKMRTLSYTMSLTQAIGPRTCQVTETQVKMKFYNNILLK